MTMPNKFRWGIFPSGTSLEDVVRKLEAENSRLSNKIRELQSELERAEDAIVILRVELENLKGQE